MLLTYISLYIDKLANPTLYCHFASIDVHRITGFHFRTDSNNQSLWGNNASADCSLNQQTRYNMIYF